MPGVVASNRAELPLLSLDLSVSYPNRNEVLRNVRLTMRHGEILGLVGQSGAGKSTLALAILGLLRGAAVQGSVRLLNRELTSLSEREMRQIRGREIALVLQSPLSSLNPILRIEAQMREAWGAHARGSRQDCEARMRQVLQQVQLPTTREFLSRRSSQLSVGQAQRVLIAMALLHRPSLLIADEPTSALDVITQAEILNLFSRLNRELGMAVLYISHDLLSVGELCHRVGILHGGEIVECAATPQIFASPAHPYTQRLMQSLPRLPLPDVHRKTVEQTVSVGRVC